MAATPTLPKPNAVSAAAEASGVREEDETEEVEEEVDEEEEPEEEEEQKPSAESLAATPAAQGGPEAYKWPGWPGDNVFRLIVPVQKVGGIIGRKGEFIRKLCEETRARVRILEGPLGSNDRIVLISAREEPNAELSPAMNAVLRVFKSINDIPGIGSDGTALATTVPGICAVKLLVASSQAVNLIGKKGESIKSIQENTGASIKIVGDNLPPYALPDERVVDIQGESLKVLKALKAVVGHLRKFLVDHSVLPLFEKSLNTSMTQDHPVDASVDKVQQSIAANEYGFQLKRDSSFLDRDSQLDLRNEVTLYGQDSALSALRTPGYGRIGGAFITQVMKTMQVPISYAEDIIGIRGSNIDYIRQSSGAVIMVQETRGVPDEITVEIKGSTSQVDAAQQLIQDFISRHRAPVASSYGGLEAGLRSTYSQFGSTFSSSSLGSRSSGGYSSSGLGGYGGYRL